MAVTLNEIAKAAGVSRGTVDRALNDRGRIRPEVAARIKKIAEEMGYTTNVSGRALAMSGRPHVIGVILQFGDTPFIQEVLTGIQAAAEEVRQFGCEVVIRKIAGPGMDTNQTVAAMEAFIEARAYAIILVGSNDPILRSEIAKCEAEDIRVITLNSDVPDSTRKFFVGQDARRSGRVAASVLGDIMEGTGSIAIFYGLEHTSQGERVRGFREVLRKNYPGIQILCEERTGNSAETLRGIAAESLAAHADIDGIYLCAEGARELCAALRQAGRDRSTSVIVHDVAACRREDIVDRTIDYVIDDDGYGQGYQAVHLLFLWYYHQKEPQEEYYYSDIRIINGYNLPG